jgi:hypothetical protein
MPRSAVLRAPHVKAITAIEHGTAVAYGALMQQTNLTSGVPHDIDPTLIRYVFCSDVGAFTCEVRHTYDGRFDVCLDGFGTALETFNETFRQPDAALQRASTLAATVRRKLASSANAETTCALRARA